MIQRIEVQDETKTECPLWVIDLQKLEFLKALTKLNNLSDSEDLIRRRILELISSKSYLNFQHFKSLLSALLTAKPDDEVYIAYALDLDFIIPEHWGPQKNEIFSTAGSMLYQTLQNTIVRINEKGEEFNSYQRTLMEGERIIQRAVSVLEDDDFKECLTDVVKEMHVIAKYLASSSLDSPFYKMNEWFGYECTRLFFEKYKTYEYMQYPFQFIKELYNLPILKITDKDNTRNWQQIKQALTDLEDSEKLIIKGILDEYIYQQALYFCRKREYIKNNEFIDTKIFTNLYILKVIENDLQGIPYLNQFFGEEDLTYTELQKILQKRFGIAKQLSLPAFKTFEDFYKTGYEPFKYDYLSDAVVISGYIKLSHRLAKTYEEIYEISDQDHFGHFFFGWPKNTMQSVTFLLGGFVLFPLINILKFFLQCLPKTIEVCFNHAADYARRENHIDVSKILYGLGYFFKGLWAIGYVITSPIKCLKLCFSSDANNNSSIHSIEKNLDDSVLSKEKNISAQDSTKMMSKLGIGKTSPSTEPPDSNPACHPRELFEHNRVKKKPKWDGVYEDRAKFGLCK